MLVILGYSCCKEDLEPIKFSFPRYYGPIPFGASIFKLSNPGGKRESPTLEKKIFALFLCSGWCSKRERNKKQALIWGMILCCWKSCTAIYWIFLINSKANVHAFVTYSAFSGISNTFFFFSSPLVSPSFGIGFYTEHWNIKVTAEQRWNSSTHFNAKQKWTQTVASGHRHDPSLLRFLK